MALLALDLGGTKLATAVFTQEGAMLHKETVPIGNRQGHEVAALIMAQIKSALHPYGGDAINSIGISVPGISHRKTHTVWAPNIPGWEAYPLLEAVQSIAPSIPVAIESDRSCYILGEVWQGAAKGCKDAIYLSVGTGIGAGIWVNGTVLYGANDIAGAVGWMALLPPYRKSYTSCGCFEQYASGTGIAKAAKERLQETASYTGVLRHIPPEKLTAQDVFRAYEQNDSVAGSVVQQCVQLWGMAVANLVSLFNPEKIILGGGVFGPAVTLIEAIRAEAAQWAQPISMSQVSIEPSALGADAGVYGAAFLALQTTHSPNPIPHVS